MNRAIAEALLALPSDGQPEGEWVSMSCLDSDEWLKKNGTESTVWSGRSDRDGIYGTPLVFTLWGNDEMALVSSVLFYENGEPGKCWHARFVEAK